MKKDGKLMSLGIMFLALTVTLLYLTTVFTTIKLTLLGLSSVVVAIAVMEIGRKAAMLVYAWSTIISLLLLTDKSVALAYALLFGCYPILKHLVEKPRISTIEWLAKLMVFNGALMAGYLLSMRFMLMEIEFPTSMAAVLMIAQLLFVIYDITLTAVIAYYIDQIRCKLFKRP